MSKTKDLMIDTMNAAAIQKKMKRYTQKNYHTEAAQELAIFVGDEAAKSQLREIAERQREDGGLFITDTRQRHEIVTGLLQQVKDKYGEELYKQFYKTM